MGDLNSDPVVNEDESPRDAETSKINFLNFLSNIQSLESYQDFIRSESLNFVCDWCHFPQDESKVSVLGHSETFVCPCENDLRFSEDNCSGEALCVQSLIDVVGETGEMPSLGEGENSWTLTRTMGKKSKKCNCKEKMFVSITNWLSRMHKSFIEPKMATNTNNSSLRSHYDDLLNNCPGGNQSEKVPAGGWKNFTSDSGYPFSVSLGEIPLYQIERTVQLNKKYRNHHTNDSAISKQRRSDNKKAKRNSESPGPPYVYSVIRKITPQDKNHFLCRPAVGSDDNFIEIRSDRDIGGLVDNLCPAQDYVDVCESRGANARVVTSIHASLNLIGTSKYIAGPWNRHGNDSVNSGTFGVPTCMPFRIFSSKTEPYVYQPLLKIKGRYAYAKDLQSRCNNLYVSRLITEGHNKGTLLHPTMCTRHHVACNSSPLSSQSIHSSKTHHAWSCFQYVTRRRPMFRLVANRTNNALSSSRSSCASCSSSVEDVYSQWKLLGMRIAKVRGDGRCLFRSLVTVMHVSLQHSPRSSDGRLACDKCEAKEKRRADKLRAEVVQYMKDNAHLYLDLEPDVINADQPIMDTYRKFKDRLDDMSNSSSYPGEMELIAASEVLERPIEVFNRDSRLIITYGENRFPSSQPLIVRFTDIDEDVGHFDAVIPLCTSPMGNSSDPNDSDHSGSSRENIRQYDRKAKCSYSDCRGIVGTSESQETMNQDLNVCNHNHRVRTSPKKKGYRKSNHGTYKRRPNYGSYKRRSNKATYKRRPNYSSYKRKDPKNYRRGRKSAESSSHKLRKSKSSKSTIQADVEKNTGFFGILKSYCVQGLTAKEDQHDEKIDKSNKRKRDSESPSSYVPRKKARSRSPCKKKPTKKQKPPGRQPSMGIRGYQLNAPSQRSCFICKKDFEARDNKTRLQCCKCYGEAHRVCAVKYSIQPPKGTWFLCIKCNQKWVKK